ncbi:MAG: IMP cyclohydrolase [Candidatus Hydrogenedentes bacterium]|nr:IMP cyclohydrolase [Candidatus Hydrogenedentota bacterium]
MYIGRIVSVVQTPAGQLGAVYRVSSRSFPNRTAVAGENKVAIVPKAGHEGDIHKNPYIAYNCVQVVCGGQVAVVTNGSQTDPIAEKIAQGMPVRDALALTSLALDFEKDDYNTPRISAVADKRDGSGWLAVVRHDGVEVRRLPLEPGRFFYVATYEENSISLAQSGAYDAASASGACEFILGQGVFAERTNPVTAVAALDNGAGFDLHAMDAAQG